MNTWWWVGFSVAIVALLGLGVALGVMGADAAIRYLNEGRRR